MHARRHSPGFNPLAITILLGGLIITILVVTQAAYSDDARPNASQSAVHPIDRRCAECHAPPSPAYQHPRNSARSLQVSIVDLIVSNAAFALNPQNGHTMSLTYNPPNGGNPVTFDGVFDEADASGERQKDARGDRIVRQAMVEAPVSLGISEKGTITAYGKNWKILGLSGRDANLETWRVQLPVHNQFRKPQSNL